VQLARIFELHAVVEGIETATHLERIQDMHSDFGQGYYFAKPLSGEDVMTVAVEQSRARTINGVTPIAAVPAPR
jgi:EAL domain-containing protein (putative c-di-GMP-specific phosphodiesterase class I)